MVSDDKVPRVKPRARAMAFHRFGGPVLGVGRPGGCSEEGRGLPDFGARSIGKFGQCLGGWQWREVEEVEGGFI